MYFKDLPRSDRQKIVKFGMSGERSYLELALEFDIPIHQIRDAVKRERKKIRTVVDNKSKNSLTKKIRKSGKVRNYKPIEKIATIVELYDSYHGSILNTSKKLGISTVSIRSWNKLFIDLGADLFIEVIYKTMKIKEALELAQINDLILDYSEKIKRSVDFLKEHIERNRNQLTQTRTFENINELVEITESGYVQKLANEILLHVGIKQSFAEVDIYTKCQIIKRISKFKNVKFSIKNLCEYLDIDRQRYYRCKDKKLSSKEHRMLVLKEMIENLRTQKIELEQLDDEVEQLPKLQPYLNYGSRRLSEVLSHLISSSWDNDEILQKL
ncbi:hypothetical protein, partial [Psittacicella hinzii]